MRAFSVLVAVVAGSTLTSLPACGQTIPFSQRGVVAQTVAFTDITVRYGRPVARGRTLFGDSAVVRWNRIWHPGADSATRISFDRDVQIEGRDVNAGEYSIWLLPRATGAWTFILSRAAHVFHTPYPGEQHDVFRLEITPERGAHMETMGIYFPVVLRDDAVLRIHWGETIIPVKIKAPYRPSYGATARILGAAVLGIEGGELASLIQVAMIGNRPYTALRDGMFAHPTLAESMNNLFRRLERAPAPA